MKIDPKFKEWACSLSGCDGGDPEAPIWICGIEWGMSANQNAEEYYKKILLEEIKKGPVNQKGEYDWKDTIGSRYGMNVAKLYASIKGHKVEQYDTIEKAGWQLFKLNLYPIAFNKTDDRLWEKYELSNITGFHEKYIFKTWCFLNRFPVFTGLVEKYNPKLIIGTGISYLTDFCVCFAGSSNKDISINFSQILVERTDRSIVKRSYYWIKFNKTTLVVIPFFTGSYGLNSNDLIQKMGESIKELIESDYATSTESPSA